MRNWAKRIMGSNEPQLYICAYHGLVERPLPVPDWCFLPAEEFSRQVEYLRENFELLSLSRAVDRLRAGPLEKPVAVITFDDGFRSVFDLAFPVLKEYGAPAAVFLVSGLVDTDDTIWFCRVHEAVSRSDREDFSWDGATFSLRGTGDKAETSAAIQARLKRFSQKRLLDEVAVIVDALGEAAGASVERNSPFAILDSTEIAEMQRSGLVEFGAHTVSHAILSPLVAAERRAEIADSLACVGRWTGRVCDLFAYPNGRAIDFDADATALLAECGVRAAVTMVEGANDAKTPALELRRIGIGADTTFDEFKDELRMTAGGR
jgi:peptidoglycan/xylan/chitin deacetylase (PgdA/CDA1 family)